MFRLVTLLSLFMVLITPHTYGFDLHEAIDSGQVAQVKQIIEQTPDLLNVKADDGLTPLNRAAFLGQT